MKSPFRLGTTSYILPDDLVANALFLAGQVQDMELVLFDLDDGTSNLPSRQTVERLLALARGQDFTYTVHLPVDVCPSLDGENVHLSVRKAHKTIAATRALQPWAYIVHLDGREVRQQPAPDALDRWQNEMLRTLSQLAEWAGGAHQLAVENLEGYPPDFVQPVMDQIEVARCVDLGHYWLDGIDPLPFLQAALPRTRVIHLHGINGRDHQSVTYIPPEKLSPVLKLLLDRHYTGVVTLEVFGEQDFLSSYSYLETMLEQMA